MDEALLLYAAWTIAMAIRPGTMNWRYSKPSTCRMRPESDSPKTTMKSVEEMTGASTVCVQSFDTRSVSRRASHINPAVPDTQVRLGGADQLPEVVQLARAAEVPALAVVGAHGPQLVRLLLGLDALGNDLHAERAGEHDNGAHDRGILAVAAYLADEGAVDLQQVHLRHLAQVPERGEADAEVVDREAHADRAQRAQAQQRRVGIGEKGALGHLEAELAGFDARLGHDRAHGVDEVGVRELPRGDVDAHRERCARALHVGCDAAHDPDPERHDQAALLSDRDEVSGIDESALGVLPANERF